MSKKHCKYIAAFDYIDKTLIVLSAISGVKILFLLQVLLEFYKCIFYSCIFFNNRNNKEIVKNNKKEKENNTIKLLCLLKAN